MMMKTAYGLIGERLGHSWSPQIHRELGGYDYGLIELKSDELEPFFRERAFRGINVTIPYKQAVIPFLDRLSPRAEAIGSVNTVVHRENGELIGYNTDFGGFLAMLRRADIRPAGKKCLVLGSGGASKTVVACLRELDAGEIRVISRTGEDHYGNLDRHADARILINATPVGMFPKTGVSPVSLDLFPELEGVADLIYNPPQTELLRQAAERGIPNINGLSMLVTQARLACELFLDREIPESEADRVTEMMEREICGAQAQTPGKTEEEAPGT